MFVDSHAHLDGKQFEPDRDQVIARAREAGVATLVAIGNGDGPPDLDAGIKLAEQHPFMYATIGIHPHEARLASDHAYAAMERLAKHPKVVAWGEIGLDYYYDHSPRDLQQRVFIQQMELAGAAKLPIVIHCRPSDNSIDGWDDTLRLIREHWSSTALGGVMHCFTGNVEQAKASLDLGFIVSFAGNITYPKAQNIRDAAAIVPLDHMFIETDSPYLAPIPHRGKRNEPAFVTEVARQIGELRGISAEQIGKQTSQNFRRFFRITD